MSWKKIGKNKYFREVEKTVNGERFRKSKTVTTNLKGLQLKSFLNSEENKLLKELEHVSAGTEKLAKMTIVELGEWYIEHGNIQENTKDSYRDYIHNRTANYFKNKKACKITQKEIKEFFKFLDNEVSEKTGRPLAQKTKKHYKTTLHKLFNILLEAKIIQENPCQQIKIKVPRQTVKDKYYSPLEVQDCLEKLFKHSTTKYTLTFLLSILAGFRPSEMQGLKWSKINFLKKEMLIDTALVKTDAGYIEKCTKNEETRIIKLNDLAIQLLQKHMESEKLKHKSLKLTNNFTDCYVFTNSRGEHVGANTFRKFWKTFCKNNEIRYVVPYGLRHTTATILAYNNVSIKAIADQMGHRSLETTGIYIHTVEEEKQEILNILDATTSSKNLKKII